MRRWILWLLWLPLCASAAQPVAELERALARGEIELAFAPPQQLDATTDARYCLAYVSLLQRREEALAARAWLSRCRSWPAPDPAALWPIRWSLAEIRQLQLESNAVDMLALAQRIDQQLEMHANWQLRADAAALLGTAHRLMDNRAAARKSLERAAALHARAAPGTREHVRVYIDLAIVYRLLGDWAAVATAIEAAQALLSDALPDPDLRASLLIQRAALMNLRGDLVASQRALQQARALVGDSPYYSLRRAVIEQNAALNEDELGDLAAARRGLRLASAAELRLRPGSLAVARVHINLGRVHFQLGAYAEAAAAYAVAEPIVESLASGKLVEAYLRSNQAELAAALGQRAQASAWFERALAINEQRPRDCYCAGPTLRDYSVFLLGGGAEDAARALPLLERALDLLAQFDNGDQQALDVRVRIAQAQMALGQIDAAVGTLASVLPTLRKRWPRSTELAEAWHWRGQLAKRSGDSGAAKRYLCRAVDTLESVEVGDDGNQLSESLFRARHAEIYHGCVGAQVDAGDADSAWRVLEKARARSLRALWRGHRVAVAGEPQAVIDDWLNYRQRMVELTRTATDPESRSADAQDALRKLQEAQQQNATQRARLRKLAPRTADILLGQRKSMAQAPVDALILAFSVGDRDTLVLYRRGKVAGGRRLALDSAQLAQRVATWRELLAARDPDALAASSEALYRDLLTPFADELARVERLHLIADGPLLGLPFAALVDPQTGRFLVQTHRIRLLESLPSAAPENTGLLPALIVADAELSGDRARGFPPLPAARAEAAAARAAIGADAQILLGANASEANVKRHLQNAGLLHFAVHGFSEPAVPLESALLLGADAAEDGALTVRELLSMPPLRASRVVLSACDSALGAEIRGDGMLSLARAFRQIGAQSVVASLWPVSDRSTAELMARFHAQLRAGASVDLALQRAQLAQLQSSQVIPPGVARGVGAVTPTAAPQPFAHPYFWAAFQVYGEGR